MSTLITGLFAALGRKTAFWAAVAVAICAALWIAWRRGRHEIHNTDRADLDRRAERWMRD